MAVHEFAPPRAQRLRIVIYQEQSGQWIGRGLEHDLQAEGCTIGEAVRSVLHFARAHVEFDQRHDHDPLSAFRPAPQAYWNAFTAGTAVPLSQLGVSAMAGWEIAVAIAHRRPTAEAAARRRAIPA